MMVEVNIGTQQTKKDKAQASTNKYKAHTSQKGKKNSHAEIK